MFYQKKLKSSCIFVLNRALIGILGANFLSRINMVLEKQEPVFLFHVNLSNFYTIRLDNNLSKNDELEISIRIWSS